LNIPVSRLGVLRAVLVEMDRLYTELPQGEQLFFQWRKNLVTIGQQIQVNMGNQIYTGMAESVIDDGSLMCGRKTVNWCRLSPVTLC